MRIGTVRVFGMDVSPAYRPLDTRQPLDHQDRQAPESIKRAADSILPTYST